MGAMQRLLEQTTISKEMSEVDKKILKLFIEKRTNQDQIDELKETLS